MEKHKRMKLACLSGKGGAGKTFVAVNLAATADTCTYIDCDVEEPNGRLFLNPQQRQTEDVCNLLPDFDVEKCNGCRKCVDFCNFHALMYIKEKPMVFTEVCHSCGGCLIVCPENAISEKPKPIGILELGKRGNIKVVTGILNPGEASGVPVIRQALKKAEGTTVIDCPPGSACSVMESVMEADYCVLIAEPTVFGFHNFQMVYELVTLLGKRCGVVINRQEIPYEPLEQFCKEHELQILERIPYDPKLAKMTAAGQLAVEQDATYRTLFQKMLHKIGGAL